MKKRKSYNGVLRLVEPGGLQISRISRNNNNNNNNKRHNY